MIDVRVLRSRLWHSLSPETAQSVGLTLEQLQRIVGGNFFPNEEILEKLARHLGLTDAERGR